MLRLFKRKKPTSQLIDIPYGVRGNPHKANIEKAIEINPKDYEVWILIAAERNRKKEYIKAVGCYQKAIGLKGDYFLAFYKMARTYRKLKQYDKSLQSQLESLKAEEKTGWYGLGYAATLLFIGRNHNFMGNPKIALKNLNESLKKLKDQAGSELERNVKYAELLIEMGISYLKLEQVDQAIKQFVKATEVSKVSESKENEYIAYQYLSSCYEALQDHATALMHFKQYAVLRNEVTSRENSVKLTNLDMSQQIRLSEMEKDTQRKLNEETEKILLRILPKTVMLELREKGKVEPQFFESTTVLFTDFVGFTKIAKDMDVDQLVKELDICFSAFDRIIQTYGMERMKTIGDGYMAVSGVPSAADEHAIKAVLAALELRDYIAEQQRAREAENRMFWSVRIGLNSGPLVAGIVGKTKFAYDVWGETVNIASRMESYGVTGNVNVSRETFNMVNQHFECEPRGFVEVKHKQTFDMFLVKGVKSTFDSTKWKKTFRI